MGLFDRLRKPAASSGDPADRDVNRLVIQGQEMVARAASAHQAAWGLGQEEEWGVDQTTGRISFFFGDKVVTSSAQILGSYSRPDRSFVWAWANASIADDLSRAAELARSHGAKHEIGALTLGRLDDLEEADASALVSLAFRITNAQGFYRDASADAVPYLTFGPTVTITPAEGEPREIKVDISNH